MLKIKKYQMRGFCPPRQKYRGDSVLADQIAGILSARDFVRRGFCPRTFCFLGPLIKLMYPYLSGDYIGKGENNARTR